MRTRELKKHLRYMVPQIRLVLVKEPGPKASVIWSPEDLDKFVEPLKYSSEEQFVSFHLDAKNHVMGYQIVSHGTLTSSLVHPREVFKAAIIANSNALIVAHNHPGGSLLPSPEDIQVTEQLIKAGALIGVQLLDHIIVSSNGNRSIRETHGYLWK